MGVFVLAALRTTLLGSFFRVAVGAAAAGPPGYA
eukprot:COSAG02_NODE_30299_length_554_cov_0.454945_1_plen_33_part_10